MLYLLLILFVLGFSGVSEPPDVPVVDVPTVTTIAEPMELIVPEVPTESTTSVTYPPDDLRSAITPSEDGYFMYDINGRAFDYVDPGDAEEPYSDQLDVQQ